MHWSKKHISHLIPFIILATEKLHLNDKLKPSTYIKVASKYAKHCCKSEVEESYYL